MLGDKLCAVVSDEILHVVKRMKSDKEYDVYVFSEDTSNLKKKDFKEEGVSNVYFSNRSIYLDDTVKSIKYKISAELNVPEKELYFFMKREITKENKEHLIRLFLRNAFREGNAISIAHLNQMVSMFFDTSFNVNKGPFPFKDDAETIRYEEAKRKVKKLNFLKSVKYINVPILFSLTDIHQIDVIFAVNPYMAPLMNENNDVYNYVSHINTDVGSFNTENSEIYVVCKNDFSKFADEHLSSQKESMMQFYFKDDYVETTNNQKLLLNRIDKIKKDVNAYDYEDSIKTLKCKIISVKILTPKMIKLQE